MNDLVIAILAAGKGKRMKSTLPKVLHKINGKTLIEHVINTSSQLKHNKTIVIIGYKKDLVIETLKPYNVEFAIQNNQKGTGHAVLKCEKHLENSSGNILILSGDVPLITKETLQSLILVHKTHKSKASLLSASIDDPSGYGRIKRDSKNKFISIVEDKDANTEELLITEINSGIYIFDIKFLFSKLSQIKNNNAQGEYYLGDVLKDINKEGISILETPNINEI